MSYKFVNPIDLQKLELQNAVIQNLGTAPSSPLDGQLYWDSGSHRPYYWNNNASAWQNKATDSDLLGGQDSAFHLSRVNHTGTQAASTISDFDTQVRTSRIDQMASPTSSVSLNSQKITNMQDGVSLTDGATVGQCQAAAAGIDAKQSCKFTTTANISLSGLNTQAGGDWGSALDPGTRILVKDQSINSENGIYTAAVGAWSRSSDCNSSSNYTAQAFTFIEESATTLTGSQWKVSTSGIFTIGSTSITWVQFGAGNTRKFAADVGDGSSTSITVTHNLGTRDVTVQLRLNTSTYEYYGVSFTATTINTVTLTFSVAPTINQYRVIVVG